MGWGAGLAGEGEGERADTAPSPPGPARTVLTRAKDRACAASCRAASTPDPGAPASLATAPAVTEAVNTALKGGGGGGSSTSGFLRAALQRGKAQRGQEERSSLLSGVPLRQCRLVAGGANEAREGNWAGVGDREEIQKGAVTCWKSQDELWHVRSHLFFSFDKYILSASYVPGRAVDAED